MHRASEQARLPFEDAPRQRRAGARRSFHVRSHQTAAEAQAGEARALRQEDAILGWFWMQATEGRLPPAPVRFTPSEVHAAFPQWPITSIRRSLTNLTKRGLLVHFPADRRMGPLGSKESTWGLA